MRRRPVLGVLVVLIGSLAADPADAAGAKKPRRPDRRRRPRAGPTSGCYGSKFHRTPHLDRLAASGPAVHPGLRRVPGLLADARGAADRQAPGAARPDRLAARPRRPARPEAAAAADPPGAAAGGGDARRGLQGGRLRHRASSASGTSAARASSRPARASTSTSRGDAHRHAAQLLRPVRARQGGRCPGLENAPEGEYLTDRLTTEAERFIEAHTVAARSSSTCRTTPSTRR